jgi:hypothetical protein
MLPGIIVSTYRTILWAGPSGPAWGAPVSRPGDPPTQDGYPGQSAIPGCALRSCLLFFTVPREPWRAQFSIDSANAADYLGAPLIALRGGNAVPRASLAWRIVDFQVCVVSSGAFSSEQARRL